MSGLGMEYCTHLLRHLHLTLTFRYGSGAMAGMSNRPSTTSLTPSFLAAALDAMWRLCQRGNTQPARLSAIAGEGHKAFTDALPLSVCPYVRPQEVDRWRAGWLDAQSRQETLAAVAALLHGSPADPGETIKQFQQDTFGAGEAYLIRAHKNEENLLRGDFQNSRASLGATRNMHAARSRASMMKPSRS